jgi:hypothetical protein
VNVECRSFLFWMLKWLRILGAEDDIHHLCLPLSAAICYLRLEFVIAHFHGIQSCLYITSRSMTSLASPLSPKATEHGGHSRGALVLGFRLHDPSCEWSASLADKSESLERVSSLKLPTLLISTSIHSDVANQFPSSFQVIGRPWDVTRKCLHSSTTNWFVSSELIIRDNPANRTLEAASFTDTSTMTVESCISFCGAKSFIYAGVEFGQECCRLRRYLHCKARSTDLTQTDCDNFIQNGGANTPLTDCKMPCTGKPAESCGAGFRLNLFFSGGAAPPPPIIVPSVGQWVSLGCYRLVVRGSGISKAQAFCGALATR